MDLSIFLGVSLAVAVLFDAIGESRHVFISHEALVVVGCGLLSASLVHFPMSELLELGPRLKVMFFFRKRHYREDILLLLALSHKLHTQGRIAIEQEASQLKDRFMRNAMALIIANYSPEHIKMMLKEMIDNSEKRHEQGIHYFEQLAKYAPGFALVGTLIGLVKLLSNLSDPKSIGPNMGTALVSTFYGVTLSNLVFLPLSGRLRVMSYMERIHKEILIEGIVSMAKGELPYVVREKVYMLVTDKDKKQLLDMEKAQG